MLVHVAEQAERCKAFATDGQNRPELVEPGLKALKSGLPSGGEGREFIVDVVLMPLKKAKQVDEDTDSTLAAKLDEEGTHCKPAAIQGDEVVDSTPAADAEEVKTPARKKLRLDENSLEKLVGSPLMSL